MTDASHPRKRVRVEHTCPVGSNRSACACVRARRALRREQRIRRCTEPGCSRPHNSHGLCTRHYMRARSQARRTERTKYYLPIPEGHQRCARCKVVKPLEEFHRHRTQLNGRTSRCRPCRLLDNRKRLYGITEGEIETLYLFQGGRCPIGWHEAPFAVDHCHEGGQVRGLLCRRHNKGLGFFDHDPASFADAISFLLLHR